MKDQSLIKMLNHVTHHSTIKQMIQSGRDIERRVLVSAVKAHTEYRILIHGKRTLIFRHRVC